MKTAPQAATAAAYLNDTLNRAGTLVDLGPHGLADMATQRGARLALAAGPLGGAGTPSGRFADLLSLDDLTRRIVSAAVWTDEPGRIILEAAIPRLREDIRLLSAALVTDALNARGATA